MIKTKKLLIFALAAHGEGISGGDRIFIEFARRWSKKFPIDIFVWKEGYEMCHRQKLTSRNVSFLISDMRPWSRLGFVVNYLARIVEGIKFGLTLNLENSPETFLYSASEFAMDLLSCFFLKLRHKRVTWVASWYQTAPNPIQGFSKGRYRFKAFLYWLAQLPVKPLVANFADFVLVNNVEEKKQFPKLNKQGRAVVVIGAVPLTGIKAWRKKNKKLPPRYDAVFQGRFHPQKGVVELVGIWQKVVAQKPNAKLAMIGDGPLMAEVESQVTKHKLQKNIKLFGYVFDGPKKYKIFSQSRVVVHPAFYDSGGMASAEAMAFGLPAVGFDLASYSSYYPKGMAKVEKGNLKAFAQTTIDLLTNKKKYNLLAKEAREMIERSWSWDKRAEEILSSVQK